MPDASSAFFDAFEKMIGLIDDENKELHILGDLNYYYVKSVSDQPMKRLKAIYEAYQLSQLITEGTRITSNSSCTLIDHYVTSMPEKSICHV
jgi:fructose-1,6-bisphosphatase